MQCDAEPRDGLQPRGPLAPFDEADMRAVQAGRIGKGLLREATAFANLLDHRSKLGDEPMAWHG